MILCFIAGRWNTTLCLSLVDTKSQFLLFVIYTFPEMHHDEGKVQALGHRTPLIQERDETYLFIMILYFVLVSVEMAQEGK